MIMNQWIDGLSHNMDVVNILKFMSERLNGLQLYQYQYEMIRLLDEYNVATSLQELSNLASNPDDFSSETPSLKKRIKYCKNPLERKKLERQVNAVYKKTKKRR